MSRELFWRRTRPRGVSWSKNRRPPKRDWKRLSVLALRGLAAAVVAAAVVRAGPAAVGGLRGLLFGQESLEARRVVLEGNRLVTREQVVAALRIGAGDNLVELDLAAMARRLELVPGVRSALIRTQYPSALYVRIVERRPLMLVGEEEWLVDEEGVVMGRGDSTPEVLPLVVGVSAVGGRLTDPSAAATVAALRDAAREAGVGWPGAFTSFDLSKPGQPVGFLEDGVPVLLGREAYREKLRRLAWVLPQLAAGEVPAAYIDLRFDSRAVVGRRPEEPETGNEKGNDVG